MIIIQFISDVSNTLKANNLDDFISPRYIYNSAQSIIADFLKKENNSNRLTFKVIEGWSEIPNIPMIEVGISECNLGVNTCQKLMRSKYQLPEMYESKFGGLIKQVMSLNLGTDYKNVYSPKQYVAASKREFGNGRYFFFLNNYLYIPVKTKEEGSPEICRMEAYFKNKWDVDQYIVKIESECADCNISVDKCKRFLDYQMVIPFGLENDVKKELLNILLKSKQIQSDNYPNLNDLDKTNQRDKK